MNSVGRVVAASERAHQLLDLDSEQILESMFFELLGVASCSLSELEAEGSVEGSGRADSEVRYALTQLGSNGKWVCVLAGQRVRQVDSVEHSDDLSRKERARDDMRTLISGFAHEIRNPLAGILSITESVLHSSKTSEFVREMLEHVPELVDRIETVISESVDFSRPRTPRPSRVDLEGVLQQTLDERPVPQQVEVRLDACSRAPTAAVDRWQARKILSSLLENAYDSGATTVVVEVRAFPHDGPRLGARIAVTDDGEGIPQEIRHEIFRPFFTTRAQKTGLGLAAARDLARLNGGKLELVDDTPDRTRFEVTLPIDSEADVTDEGGT